MFPHAFSFFLNRSLVSEYRLIEWVDSRLLTDLTGPPHTALLHWDRPDCAAKNFAHQCRRYCDPAGWISQELVKRMLGLDWVDGEDLAFYRLKDTRKGRTQK